MGGLFLLSSVFGIVALIVPVALVLGLVVVFSLRGEPDDGARGITLYLALATFVGFLTLLVATTALSAGITDLVGGDDAGSTEGWFNTSDSFSGSSSGSMMVEGFSDSGAGSFSPVPSELLHRPAARSADDRAWTTIIQALLAALAALAVLRFHGPRLEAAGRSAAGSAAARVRQSYCYVACLSGVVTLLTTVTVGSFNLVQAVAPGVTGISNRGDAIEAFVPVATLALGAGLLFWLHWSRVDTPAFLRRMPPPAEGDGDV